MAIVGSQELIGVSSRGADPQRDFKREQLNMNVIRKPLEQGLSNRFAFLNRASLARWSPIPLRLIVGYGFMQHGFAKLSKGLEAFAVVLHAIGVPAPHPMGRKRCFLMKDAVLFAVSFYLLRQDVVRDSQEANCALPGCTL